MFQLPFIVCLAYLFWVQTPSLRPAEQVRIATPSPWWIFASYSWPVLSGAPFFDLWQCGGCGPGQAWFGGYSSNRRRMLSYLWQICGAVTDVTPSRMSCNVPKNITKDCVAQRRGTKGGSVAT